MTASFSSLSGSHAITPSHEDPVMEGTVEVVSLIKGAIFIRGTDRKRYFCPTVKFPPVPGSTYRGAAIGTTVYFYPKVDETGRDVVDIDQPIEAHMGNHYVVQDAKPLPVKNGAVGLICSIPDSWKGQIATDTEAEPSVSCTDFAAFRTEGPFDSIRILDRTEFPLVALVLAGDNKEPVDPAFVSNNEFVVYAGVDVLYAFPDGRVLVQTLAKRSSWEGKGYPARDRNHKDWHHFVVVGQRRFEQTLDVDLLTSGDVEAIRTVLPTSGLAVDNDRYAEAIAEAGLSLKKMLKLA